MVTTWIDHAPKVHQPIKVLPVPYPKKSIEISAHYSCKSGPTISSILPVVCEPCPKKTKDIGAHYSCKSFHLNMWFCLADILFKWRKIANSIFFFTRAHHVKIKRIRLLNIDRAKDDNQGQSKYFDIGLAKRRTIVVSIANMRGYVWFMPNIAQPNIDKIWLANCLANNSWVHTWTKI